MAENKPLTPEELRAVASAFAFKGGVTEIEPCGNGHINHTFIVTTTAGRYVLQVVNTAIFTRPEEVMENIVRVTDHIRAGLLASGGDAERGTMRVIPSAADPSVCWYRDGDGRFWRAYDFVEHTVCHLTLDSPEAFRQVGWAFGRFQRQLADFDASLLHESIPDFHNTKKRYAAFLEAVSADRAGRAASVQDEIDFINERSGMCSVIVDALESGLLPLRVTHNDTKLSNILMDEVTDECVCVIDLDTVMPGSSLYDFGDSIRTGACSAAEDEQDLSLVDFRPEMFIAYAEGFIEGTDGALTETELAMLPDGAYVITLEQAIRFLTDYLNGDTYYHTDYPDHNLVRTCTQLKMLEGMERDQDLIRTAVAGL
ncbi:MAG: aminoglycoside phosphotransferase family protein [Clostridia bacterium]|nr:aminoglycoside phosphotransferase family protein [Clostridia bacterium]